MVLLPEEEAVQFLQQQQLSASDVRSLLKLQWTNGAYHVIPSHASEVCVEPPSSQTPARPPQSRTNVATPICTQRAAQPSPNLPRQAQAPSSSSSLAVHENPVAPECLHSARGRSSPDTNAVGSLPRGQSERHGNCAACEGEECNQASSSSSVAGNGGAGQLFPSRAGSSEGDRVHQTRLDCGESVVEGNETQRLSEETPGGAPVPAEVAMGVGGTVAALFGARSTAAFLDGVEGEAEADQEEDRADVIRARSRLGPHLVGGGRAAGIDEEDEGDESNSAFFLHSGVSLPAGFAGGGTGGPGAAGVGGEGRGYTEKIWLVVRSMRERGGVKLREGDVMKLGRFRLKVKELVANYQQAALAQERRLPAADTDECETVAPEPESHNNPTAQLASSATTSHHHHFPGSLGSLVPAVVHHQHRISTALSSSIPAALGTPQIGVSGVGTEVGGGNSGGVDGGGSAGLHAGAAQVPSHACPGADVGRSEQIQATRAIDDEAAGSGSQGEGSVRTSARDATQRTAGPIRALSGSASALSRLSGPAASRVSSRSGAGFSDSVAVCGTEGECGGRGSDFERKSRIQDEEVSVASLPALCTARDK